MTGTAFQAWASRAACGVLVGEGPKLGVRVGVKDGVIGVIIGVGEACEWLTVAVVVGCIGLVG